MNQFYVSIIFIGITLIVISLVWIAYDRKKSYDYADQLNAKKKELVGIISDAEQMVEEMNKFSDYVVSQMDLKNEEINQNIKNFEKKIEQLNSRAEEAEEVKAVKSKLEKVVNGNTIDIKLDSEMDVQGLNFNSDLVIDNIRLETASAKNNYCSRQGAAGREKVIPINSKYKEVINLAQSGMCDTEIAKYLKMGKGEVQLILGMNK